MSVRKAGERLSAFSASGPGNARSGRDYLFAISDSQWRTGGCDQHSVRNAKLNRMEPEAISAASSRASKTTRSALSKHYCAGISLHSSLSKVSRIPDQEYSAQRLPVHSGYPTQDRDQVSKALAYSKFCFFRPTSGLQDLVEGFDLPYLCVRSSFSVASLRERIGKSVSSFQSIFTRPFEYLSHRAQTVVRANFTLFLWFPNLLTGNQTTSWPVSVRGHGGIIKIR